MTTASQRSAGTAGSAALVPGRLRPADLASLASIGLRTRKLRAGLSALGIAIGVAAIVAVLGLAASSQAALLNEISQLGTNLLTVTNGQTFTGENAELPSTAPGMIARLPGITSVQDIGTVSGVDVYKSPYVRSGHTNALSVDAATLGLPAAAGTSLAQGRYLNAATEHEPTAVLGAAAAQRLGIDRIRPGMRIWVGGQWFYVTGILTATPYRRDRLDDLIGLQVGPVRYTISHPAARASDAPGRACELPDIDAASGLPVPRPVPVLHVHPTAYRYAGDADPSAPGGIAAIYRDLAADDSRVAQVIADVTGALAGGRHCLVLTKWITHLNRLADALHDRGFDPVVLRGGMGARSRAAAIGRLQPREGARPLLVVATGSCIGEGFDCPALDTLFLAAPVGYKGSIIQWAGRILRSVPGKTTAEVHDYHDVRTPVIAATLGKRAPGYTSLGFPDPRRLALTPSSQANPQ